MLKVSIQVHTQTEDPLKSARFSDCGRGKASPWDAGKTPSSKIVAPHHQTSQRAVTRAARLRVHVTCAV